MRVRNSATSSLTVRGRPSTLALSPTSERPTSSTVLVTFGSFISGIVPCTRSRLDRTSNSPSVSRSRSRSRPSASSRRGALNVRRLPLTSTPRGTMFHAPSLRISPTVVWHCTPSCSSPSTMVCRRSMKKACAASTFPRRPIMPPCPPGPEKPISKASDPAHIKPGLETTVPDSRKLAVEADHRVRMVVVEQTLRDHRLRAFDDLLRRLKDEEVAAAHVPDAIDQRARDAHHDRHVRVVPARMHPSIRSRREIHARFLVDGQPVDVRAQHHRLPRLARVEHRDDSRFGRTWFQLQAELAQAFAQLP